MPELDEDIHSSAVAANFSRTRMYVIGTIMTAAMAVVSIIVLAIFKPDNTSAGTLVMGVLLPIITAFLAASIGHLGAQIDGRLTQLLTLTAKASKAEGKATEKQDNLDKGPVSVAVINEPTVVVKKPENLSRQK